MPHSRTRTQCAGAPLLALFEKWDLWDTQGAALLEFAVALPILVVFVVGIYDFSGAFNQKQKIAQAAQEGAILAASQPMSDISSAPASNPASLQAVVTAIYNSLLNNGVIPTGTCALPATTPGPTGLKWTYTISGCNTNPARPNSLVITINRGKVFTATAPVTIATVVSIQYTYYWQFNSVIQLLFNGSSSYSATTPLSETATVHNQM